MYITGSALHKARVNIYRARRIRTRKQPWYPETRLRAYDYTRDQITRLMLYHTI